MAKKYKVKRYYGKDVGFYRAKPHPLLVVLVIAFLVGLGFLGWTIYEPVYNFIMNIGAEESEPEPEASLPQEPESEPESEPEPEPAEPDHEKLRAVYAPHEIASDAARLDVFLSGLTGTDINAVMVDVKNQNGEVLFKTSNVKAAEWGAVVPTAIDLEAVSEKLAGEGYGLIANMSVFRDPLAAGRGRLEYAIGYRDVPSVLWLDDSPENGGRPWLNPYAKPSQDYLGALISEITGSGVELLVLSDLRFPDNSATYAVFNPQGTDPPQTRSEILIETLESFRALAGEDDVRVAVFATAVDPTLTSSEQNRYGGPVRNVLSGEIILDVRPALFGGDFSQQGLEVRAPLENPAGAVSAGIGYMRSGVPGDATVIPYLQGGNDESFNAARAFGKADVDAQVNAAAASGCEEYILYSADGAYLLK